MRINKSTFRRMREQMAPSKAVETELFYKLRTQLEPRGGFRWGRFSAVVTACVCVCALIVLALYQPWRKPEAPGVPRIASGVVSEMPEDFPDIVPNPLLSEPELPVHKDQEFIDKAVDAAAERLGVSVEVLEYPILCDESKPGEDGFWTFNLIFPWLVLAEYQLDDIGYSVTLDTETWECVHMEPYHKMFSPTTVPNTFDAIWRGAYVTIVSHHIEPETYNTGRANDVMSYLKAQRLTPVWDETAEMTAKECIELGIKAAGDYLSMEGISPPSTMTQPHYPIWSDSINNLAIEEATIFAKEQGLGAPSMAVLQEDAVHYGDGDFWRAVVMLSFPGQEDVLCEVYIDAVTGDRLACALNGDPVVIPVTACDAIEVATKATLDYLNEEPEVTNPPILPSDMPNPSPDLSFHYAELTGDGRWKVTIFIDSHFFTAFVDMKTGVCELIPPNYTVIPYENAVKCTEKAIKAYNKEHGLSLPSWPYTIRDSCTTYYEEKHVWLFQIEFPSDEDTLYEVYLDASTGETISVTQVDN